MARPLVRDLLDSSIGTSIFRDEIFNEIETLNSKERKKENSSNKYNILIWANLNGGDLISKRLFSAK